MDGSKKKEKIRIAVDAEGVGQRADRFLHERLPDLSREKIKSMIENGQVKVFSPVKKEFIQFKPSLKLVEGMIFEVEAPDRWKEEGRLSPQDIPIEIVYEDEYLLAINKPSGMVVHPGAGVKDGTIANAVLNYLEKVSTIDPTRPGIVHRLDKETSGLLLIAKDNRTHVRLSRMFEKRRIRKDYLALVWGWTQFDSDVINLPIERHPKHRELFRVGYGPSAREAITEYETLKRLPDETSLLLVHPITGRTHQIRVHLSHIGHPIVGDKKYGRRHDHSDKMFLHAWRIKFLHPISGEEIVLTAPPPWQIEIDL